MLAGMALPVTAPARRGLILARISRDHTSLGAGVERQIRSVERIFEDQGIEFDRDDSLVDNSVSSFNRRASFDGAIAAIRSHEYDVIGVAALDRLSRGLPEVVNELVPALFESGATIMTEDGETFDTRSGEWGRAQLYAAVMRGNQERARISKRTHDFHADYAADGRPAGRVPFGYRAIVDELGRNNWEPVPEEAALVRSSVEDLLRGTSINAVLRRFWDSGLKTRTGADWRQATLRRYLLTPTIAGIRRHHHFTRHPVTGKFEPELDRAGRPLPPDDTEAIWPGIISVEQHEALTRLLGSRTEPRRAVRSSIPSPILRCALCGGPMTTGRGRNGARNYACKRRNSPASCGRLQIVAEPLEEVIGAQIVAVIRESPVFPSEEGGHEEELTAELADLDARIESLVEEHFAGDLPRAAYERTKATLDGRRAAAAEALEELRATDTRGSYLRTLRAQGFDMDRWTELSVDERRSLVSDLVERVTVYPAGPKAWSPDHTRHLELVNERVEIHWAV